MTTAAPGVGRDTPGAGDRDGRLLLDAVRFVERAVIASERDGSTPVASGGPEPLRGDKVRCEASMLLRAAWPVAGSGLRLGEALATLAGELDTINVAELAVRLCLHPGVALDLALVPLHLRALGRGGDRLESLLADLFGSDRVRGPERPANRELEQLWLHGLWSGDLESGDVAQALARSSLAWEFDHLDGSTDDAYAFTHAILYATDLGLRRAPLPRPAGEIVRDAEAILAVALDAGNHDVAAEALWTWPMLAVPWTPLATEAGAFLAEVAESNGFLPGPGFDPALHESLPLAEREVYELRTSYHTTLVHGLLLAAVLRGGRHSPRDRGGSSAMTGSSGVAAVAALLPQRRSSAAWWSWFGHLPAARSGALAPALVTMALRRAVAASDLAGVHHVLTLADDHRLPESPASRQARVLLRRAVACATTGLVSDPGRGRFPTRTT